MFIINDKNKTMSINAKVVMKGNIKCHDTTLELENTFDEFKWQICQNFSIVGFNVSTKKISVIYKGIKLDDEKYDLLKDEMNQVNYGDVVVNCE